MKALADVMGARMKRAVQAAISANDGVVEAVKVVRRVKATVSRWNDRWAEDMPPLDAALALDLTAQAAGRGTPIASALAIELGAVLVALPHTPEGDGEWFDRLGRLSGEVGESMQTMARALSDDGQLDDDEIDENVKQLDDVLQVAAEMRTALLARRGARGGK